MSNKYCLRLAFALDSASAKHKHHLASPKTNHGNIIVLLAALGMLADSSNQALADGGGRHGTGIDGLEEPLHLKFLILLVLGFGDPVGEKDNDIAGIQRHGA